MVGLMLTSVRQPWDSVGFRCTPLGGNGVFHRQALAELLNDLFSPGLWVRLRA